MRKFSVLIAFIVILSAISSASAQDNAQPTSPQTEEATAPLVVAPELFIKGQEADDGQRFDRAVLDYSLFILLNPTYSQGYFSRGLSYQSLGELDSALDDITHALEFTSPAPEYTALVYLTRAQIYIQKDDIDSALSDLDSSIKAYPDATESLLLRARVYSFQRRLDDALSDYSSVIRIEPENIDAYLERGYLNYQLRHLKEALDDYNHALAISPDSIQGYVDRAILHNANADFQSALADMNSAINLSPDTGSLYFIRGSINEQAKNITQAASDYFQALNLGQTRIFTAPESATTSQSFTLQMSEGWVYHIPFEASAGQTVTAQASQISTSRVDPLLVIIDADNTPLVANDDSGGNVNAAIEDYEIPKDGQYTLIVGHAQGGFDGDITVSLNFADQP
jgi:tetratricopeptide (TPR) repeat protein